ncbi:hypothetical protein JB92DRAFT_2835387 [Gautieria morchelliformis]|nr:hypothetical protein JB92DRAFT_2835387 [Gautieria morchelliformis]
MLLLVLEHDIKSERVGRGAAHGHGYGVHVCREMIDVDPERRKRTFEAQPNPDDTFDDTALAAILHAAGVPRGVPAIVNDVDQAGGVLEHIWIVQRYIFKMCSEPVECNWSMSGSDVWM